MTSYKLKAGTYLVGDPALIFKKDEAGTKLTQELWNIFYQDANQFQYLTLDSITFYITRTAEGDGYYQGVGTDTGTIMIIHVEEHIHDQRLNLILHRRGMLTLELPEDGFVEVDHFNIYFSNGQNIRTNSDVV